MEEKLFGKILLVVEGSEHGGSAQTRILFSPGPAKAGDPKAWKRMDIGSMGTKKANALYASAHDIDGDDTLGLRTRGLLRHRRMTCANGDVQAERPPEYALGRCVLPNPRYPRRPGLRASYATTRDAPARAGRPQRAFAGERSAMRAAPASASSSSICGLRSPLLRWTA